MVDVKPGQIWADNDWRSKGRTLRVDSVDEVHATCTVLTNSDDVQSRIDSSSWGFSDTRGKVRRIRLDRFRPTSTGYRLLS
jgi:hypothetical protein